MSIIRNAVKIMKLKKVKRTLATMQRDKTAEEQAAAKTELFHLIYSQRDLRKLMENHGKTEADLDELYEALCQCTGEAQKKAYVPVDALAYRHTLKYVLDNWEGLLHSEERRKTIGWVLTTYFKRNDILDVNESRYLQEVEYEKKRKAEREAKRAVVARKIEARENEKKVRLAAKHLKQKPAGVE